MRRARISCAPATPDLTPGLTRSEDFVVEGILLGASCTAYATLREIVDGRKLRFDVEVREGDRVLGVGTHERRVIDVAGHAGAISAQG